MGYRVRPEITGVDVPPISESFSWLAEGKSERTAILLSQAVPSYSPAPDLQTEIARLAQGGDTNLYTEILGLPELRAELASHFSVDYHARIPADHVAITAGSNQAFCLAVASVAGPGSNIIVPSPYFFNHQMWLQMQNIGLKILPTDASNAMLPDPEVARTLIDAKTAAIVLVTPNNPTGAIYPPDLIHQFFQLARTHGIALIIDETYKDFRASEQPAHALFCEPNWQDTFIHLYSFSKTFAMTGYRVGSLTAAPMLVAEIEKLMDCVAICAPHIGQGAALYGLRNLQNWARQKAVVMAEREQALREAFRHPALKYRIVSSGAFFAYVEHPFADETGKDVAKRLAREHDLLTLPGSMFGPNQECFLRIAFANAEADTMPEVVARLLESQ